MIACLLLMLCGAYSQCKVYISFISLRKLWDILVANKEFNNISIYAFHEYFIHLKRWSHYRGSKVAYLVGKFILMYSQKSVYWYFSFVWRCYWYVLSILLTLPNGWGHIYNGGLMCGDAGRLDISVFYWNYVSCDDDVTSSLIIYMDSCVTLLMRF